VSDEADSRRFPLWLAIILAMLCGTGVALQSSINGELAARLHNGFVAAVISFGSGLLLLAVGLAFSPSGRRGLSTLKRAVRARELRWWNLFGGFAGALLVLSQGLTVALLGVALFTVATVAGQTLSGLVLDRIGVGPSGRHHLTAPRVIGAVLCLIAVTWAVSAQLRSDVAVWVLILPIIAGVGVGWQQAVNGQVRERSGSAYTATFINFLAGTVVLTAAVLVDTAIVGWPKALPPELWLYLGGPIGCVFIAGAALLVRRTGVLVYGLALVAGQLIAALGLDILLPTASAALAWQTIAGTCLALVAVVVAGVPWRRRRDRANRTDAAKTHSQPGETPT
jgi:bacterial/archaeal transporter family-2 protein